MADVPDELALDEEVLDEEVLDEVGSELPDPPQAARIKVQNRAGRVSGSPLR